MADPLANSYYAASVPTAPHRPRLDHDLKADVVIIGAGFTGLSAALACAEKGLDVVVLEAEKVGFGASGRNGGQMIPGFNMAIDDLLRLMGEEAGTRLLRLSMRANDTVRARIAKHDIDCDLHAGHVHLAAKPGDYADFAAEVAGANRLMGADAARLVPPEAVSDYVNVEGYHGAIYTPQGGHLHPMKYTLGLTQAALAAGVRIFEHSKAESLNDATIPTVRTANGSVAAQHAILACDAYMGDIAPRTARYTMPVLNYIIATEPLGEERAKALIPSGAAVSDSKFVLNYFRLSADHRLLFAGGEKYSPEPPRDIAAFVRPYMLKLFPQLADAKIDYAWGGAVGITVNRLPHFGREGNILFAHGYSGQGALLTTLAGELMADAISGKPENFDLFVKIPHRAFPGGKLLRTPIYMAAMLYSAMRDRL